MKINTSHWINQKEIANYLNDIKKHKPISREDEFELIKLIKAGDLEARKTLIYSNLRFVINIAKPYQNKGLEFADIISEGNYGLLKAAEKFDLDQTDTRFISYAVWWIRQSIMQALNETSRIIRLPVNRINDLYKALKDEQRFDEFTPTDDILFVPRVETLDRTFDEDGHTMYDVIPDSEATPADANLNDEAQNLNAALNSVLNMLTATEKNVITRYFGINSEECTLEEIAKDMDLTKERVRQIKEKAIKKLRSNSYKLFELL